MRFDHIGFYDIDGGYHMTIPEGYNDLDSIYHPEVNNMLEIQFCPFCGKEVPGKITYHTTKAHITFGEDKK
jgi:hypothetical protein